MRSIKEQRDDLNAGDRIDEAEMLDWAERARAMSEEERKVTENDKILAALVRRSTDLGEGWRAVYSLPEKIRGREMTVGQMIRACRLGYRPLNSCQAFLRISVCEGGIRADLEPLNTLVPNKKTGEPYVCWWDVSESQLLEMCPALKRIKRVENSTVLFLNNDGEAI